MKRILPNEADYLIATNKSVEEINRLLKNGLYVILETLERREIDEKGIHVRNGYWRDVYVTYYPSEKETVLAIRIEIGIFVRFMNIIFFLFYSFLALGYYVREGNVSIMLVLMSLCFAECVYTDVRARSKVRRFFCEELEGHVVKTGI